MSSVTPIKLQLNKRYPSYQLYAVAGTRQTDPEEVFKTCVLHTYKWLRARFDGFALEDLVFPDPSESRSFDLSELRSVSLTDPYPIEVFWLPEDKVWCLRLTEPDNGNTATDFRPAREGVAGRFFETNVGYRITEAGVECGFNTVVSEPEGVDEPVESFRLACIKDIARDANAGLFHGYKLQDVPVSIGSGADVRKLVRWIRSDERQLPVIISDLGTPKADAKSFEDLPSVEDFLRSRPLNQINLISQITAVRPAMPPAAPKGRDAGDRVDIKKLARYRMGYAQYFLVEKDMSELLRREFSDGYRQGGLTVFEPSAFGARVSSYDAFSEKTEQQLDAFASGYSAKKPMTFGNVLFAADARELSSRLVADLADSKEALVKAYEERIAAINARHEDEISLYRARLDDQVRETARLEKFIDNIQTQIAREQMIRQKRHEEELERLSAGHEDALKELELYRGRERRPDDLKRIPEWVAAEFAGKLILHEKAVDLLGDLKSGEWNVDLICDALEFLATDYRDELTGAISESQMMENCSRKYGRPFDVTPLSFPSSGGAPKEYKIKYYIGHKGKPVESVLDLHLRVGNTSEDLIRIYFLYDSEKKLIVVGSLPKHLPTLSYK